MEGSGASLKRLYDDGEIADACLTKYRGLGLDRKQPVQRADGKFEWTILAGVVISWSDVGDGQRKYRCITLATGVKATPYAALSQHGDVLHDCHAEVLARRMARQWILERIRDHILGIMRADVPAIFEVIDRGSTSLPPFKLKDEFKFHLFCSSLPCGDMSSAHLLRKRMMACTHDASVPFQQPCTVSAGDPLIVLRGRDLSAYEQSCLRTKPGRPQSSPSLSLSCSDKIALWTMSGFQGSLIYPLTGPLYFVSCTFGIDGSCGMKQELLHTECQAAQATRAVARILRLKCTPSTTVPQVGVAACSFSRDEHAARRRVLHAFGDAKLRGSSDDLMLIPSAISVVWGSGTFGMHCIVDGRKQGAANKRLQGHALHEKSRSLLCKLSYFEDCLRTYSLYSCGIYSLLRAKRYHDCKTADNPTALREYSYKKQEIMGTRNMAKYDRLQYQERCAELFVRKGVLQLSDLSTALNGASRSHESPLLGWLVTGRKYKAFLASGCKEIE